MDAHGQLVALLRERSLKTGDFLLSSGKRSSWYIDCRRSTMHAEGLALVGELGLLAIREAGWAADAVGGMTLGADPVAYAIALASHQRPPAIHGFTVRKAAKGHGTGRRIEGCFEPGSRVVVVEDALTTGASALAAIEAVREEGGRVSGLLVVVDRGEGGREAVARSGVEVRSLIEAGELLKGA